jgi:hypothetical protein
MYSEISKEQAFFLKFRENDLGILTKILNIKQILPAILTFSIKSEQILQPKINEVIPFGEVMW